MASPAMPGCETRATLHLVGAGSWTEVLGVFGYAPADPFAVRIRFGGRPVRPDVADRRARHPAAQGRAAVPEDEGVEWLVARDLLHTGLSRPAGGGDVRLWPARTGGDVLFLELRAPSGHALFEVPRSVVAAFLAETESLVPRGAEEAMLDVDLELEALLPGDGPDPGGR